MTCATSSRSLFLISHGSGPPDSSGFSMLRELHTCRASRITSLADLCLSHQRIARSHQSTLNGPGSLAPTGSIFPPAC
eukprot:2741612-Heterocapsa_arctica.AAC.1